MSAADRVRLEASWKDALIDEFEAGYMKKLRAFLIAERQARKVIYPKGDRIFAALDATPLTDVKVVIIGQDPYHGPNQAHGLCFSVLPVSPRRRRWSTSSRRSTRTWSTRVCPSAGTMVRFPPAAPVSSRGRARVCCC